jgi:hypothetical protein
VEISGCICSTLEIAEQRGVHRAVDVLDAEVGVRKRPPREDKMLASGEKKLARHPGLQPRCHRITRLGSPASKNLSDIRGDEVAHAILWKVCAHSWEGIARTDQGEVPPDPAATAIGELPAF